MNSNKTLLFPATKIIKLLEKPTENRLWIMQKIRKSAYVKEMIKALEISNNDTTICILCDLLARRKAKSAIYSILAKLNMKPSADLKDDAAEALGKIGNKKAGQPMLQLFIEDPRCWYAIALGALQCHESIPYLIRALDSPYGLTRGGAAWSLGELKSVEAMEPLEALLQKETDTYSLQRIPEALMLIRGYGL
jgi:HEAT repeat protein